MRRLFVTLCAVVLLGLLVVAAPANFIYTAAGEFDGATQILKRLDIAGAQVVFNWKMQEPSEGQYDFSGIAADLAVMDGLGKKLVIQVQDRFFSPEARNLPAYILSEANYGGGLVPQVDNPGANNPKGYGWAAMQWNPALRVRYQAQLAALARQFDGNVFAVTLPEASV